MQKMKIFIHKDFCVKDFLVNNHTRFSGIYYSSKKSIIDIIKHVF